MLRELMKRAYSGVSRRLHQGGDWFSQVGTLEWLASFVITARGLKQFTFVEVGVFKGDNAVSVVNTALGSGAAVTYVGFDLFEHNESFFASHPDDLAMYDLPEYAYFEFGSGGHAYAAVQRKLRTVLRDSDFILVAGDSTTTIPAHRLDIKMATVVFIDGCHDYDIVARDWNNIKVLFDDNNNMVVVFDDTTYSGVNQLISEIRTDGRPYGVYRLNFNQCVVAPYSLPLKERLMYRSAGLISKLRETTNRK